MQITDLITIFLALPALAIFTPAIVNALKYFEVIADGQAGQAQTVVNLLLFVALSGFSLFAPGFSVAEFDSVLVQLGGIISGILVLLGQLGISKKTYEKFWKGRAGVFGTTFSE